MNTTLKTALLTATLLCTTALSAQAEDAHHNHAMHIGNGHSHAHHDHAAAASAPISIMGDHVHNKGEWMLSYQFRRMVMDGNINGRNDISPEDIVTTIANPNAPPATLRVVPTEMDMDMHMLGAMYGVTDKLTVMAMAMYMQNEMDHITFQGMAGTNRLGTFTTQSQGWGDTSLSAIYNAYRDNTHSVNLSLGLSLPTGSIKEEDTVLTPMNTTPRLRLPYAMQLGSGTLDAKPSVTYTGHHNKMSWGAQYNATLRTGNTNSQGYRLGNQHSATVWGGYKLTPAFSTTVHLTGETLGDIHGRDVLITAPVQTANPDNYGGERIDLGVGFAFTPTRGMFKGMEFGGEITAPLHQDRNGVQMERDMTITAGISYSF